MMIRRNFEQGLQELSSRIIELGNQVDRALYHAIESLRLRQHLLSQNVISQDNQINRERFAIEEAALTLIATQSPVAHDLRFVAGVMYIASELERMGDQAKGIARINEMMQTGPLIQMPVDLPLMADKCRQMLQGALKAFAKLDADAARQIAVQDDEVDRLYNTVYLDLLKIMSDNPQTISRATHMLWVSHNLERYADRCVNICERVVFVKTGDMTEIHGNLNG